MLINFIVLVRVTRARSVRLWPLNRLLTDDVIEHSDVNELEGVAAHTPEGQRQFACDSALAVGTAGNRYLSQIAGFLQHSIAATIPERTSLTLQVR